MSSTSETNSIETYSIAPVLPRLLTGETLSENTNLTHTQGVGTASSEYRELLARWELVIHLMGGTLAMRKAAKKYLPQEPGEEDECYDARLKRSILYGIYSRTVKALSSIPFIDPIVIKELPSELEYLKDVCTDEGLSLEEFAQDLLQDALHLGVAHFLVDYPEVPEGLNLSEERKLGAKPFFARIDPVNLIGWESENGVLKEIRIYEYSVERNAEWQEIPIHRIRVITPDTITIYQLMGDETEEKKSPSRGKKSVWKPVKTMTNSLGRVGLITIYGNKDGGILRGTPVLEELAWLNLRHYQKQSDVDNIEHVANTPFLFAKGFLEDELEEVVVGVNSLVSTTSENADIKYVEHSGAAIGASQNSIKEIEKRAVVMGADFLAQTATSRQTAYAKSVDTGKTLSVLQAIVNNVSRALEKGFKVAGEWMDKEASPDITIGEGIELSLDSGDIAVLKQLADEGYLTVENFQYELQRRGKISDSTVLEKPKKRPAPIIPQEQEPSDDNDEIGDEDA